MPVIVVSDDGDILEAASRADMSLEVLSPAAYTSLLELDLPAFSSLMKEIFEIQAERREVKVGRSS